MKKKKKLKVKSKWSESVFVGHFIRLRPNNLVRDEVFGISLKWEKIRANYDLWQKYVPIKERIVPARLGRRRTPGRWDHRYWVDRQSSGDPVEREPYALRWIGGKICRSSHGRGASDGGRCSTNDPCVTDNPSHHRFHTRTGCSWMNSRQSKFLSNIPF